MKKINKNKFKLGITLLAIALSHQPLVVAADEVLAQTNAPTLQSVKFEMDYMDNGVHVIIPKILPETRVNVGTKLASYVKFYPGKDRTPTEVARALDESVANVYASAGHEVGHVKVFDGSTKYNQVLAFAGNTQELDYLNKNYSSLSIRNSIFSGLRQLAGVAAGFVLGSAIGGTEIGLQSGANTLAGNASSVVMKNTKAAVFDGYLAIPAKDTDVIEIYGVSTQEDKYKGNVVFITEKAQVDDDVVIRGIVKAQNIAKLNN